MEIRKEDLIIICAHCRKARDKKGNWIPVNEVLLQKAGLPISHGLCPDCVKKLYPDYAAYREEKRICA